MFGRRLFFTGAVSIVLLLVLSACAAKASGMGWMQSNGGGKKATFGFVYNCTKGTFNLDGTVVLCTEALFEGSYHDPQGTLTDELGAIIATEVDVDFQGEGTMVTVPALPGFNNCMGNPALLYESQNPDMPGDPNGPDGTLNLIACDGGEPGPSSNDFIFIDVTSGPFTGYRNAGPVEGGNIQVK